eukprot:GHVP01021971.1.p1 GENE.GHVP01021971.1~~GHVP01021971.1.p1  ORF type:complete len:192 (+),score=27.58 GHVP01021971.1:46-621(+)
MQQTKNRLTRELLGLQNESEVRGHAISDDLTRWKGYISGPVDSPYAGGVFEVDITIPPDYPFRAPAIKFATKVWHPNVSSKTGAICLDVLDSSWSPAFTVRVALLSIQQLLGDPQPDDPQDNEVSQMYKNDFNQFLEVARDWTRMYASAKSKESMIKELSEMGFDPTRAKLVLQSTGWDVNRAVEQLLNES